MTTPPTSNNNPKSTTSTKSPVSKIKELSRTGIEDLSKGSFFSNTCFNGYNSFEVCFIYFCTIFLFFFISACGIVLFSLTLAMYIEGEHYDKSIVSPLDYIREEYEPKSLKPCSYPSSFQSYPGSFPCNCKYFLTHLK